MTTVLTLIGVVGWVPLHERYGKRTAWLLIGVLALVAVSPLMLVGIGAVLILHRAMVRYRRTRRLAATAERDVAVLARGLLVALSAGLSLSSGLEVASVGLSVPVVEEVRDLERLARQDGMALALAGSRGRCSRLFTVLARAHTTGASIADAVAAFVEEQREAHRVAVTEAARRLPVKLTVPLALLILPGFVVLTVGPSVLDSARRLLGPMFPIP